MANGTWPWTPAVQARSCHRNYPPKHAEKHRGGADPDEPRPGALERGIRKRAAPTIPRPHNGLPTCPRQSFST
ncbi:uncharacterized protein UV8b_07511 [Ustilaginoidea virens]|uniref:Uncharacterized protein n=1 Tax=Ustilaginoidea virens TaxID=1159556 RepID=A0A8E5HX67_USTVR|nr:uncharacterized protein UV8b_07511 [Ustilaginoidea virens]QUC23270.1 hypothetical protein UV8b_07511 [Ustilaginoidea virens]